MDWNKQAYLSINEIGSRIKTQDNSKTLLYADRVVNDTIKEYRFRTKGGKISILLELTKSMDITLMVDSAILDKAYVSIMNATVDLDKGEHIIKVVMGLPEDLELKLTLEGPAIEKSGGYRLASYDYINERVMIKDNNDKLFYVDINSTKPQLIPHEMHNYSSLEFYYPPYNDYVDAEIYLKQDGLGTVYWVNEGIVDIIEHYVTAVALLKSISRNMYSYIYAYLKDGILYYKVKYPNQRLPVAEICIAVEGCIEMIAVSSFILYKDFKGDWNMLQSMTDTYTAYLQKVPLKLKAIPSLQVLDDNTFKIYPRNKRGFMIDNQDRAMTNADVMAFYRDKVLLIWDDKVRIIDKETIIC